MRTRYIEDVIDDDGERHPTLERLIAQHQTFSLLLHQERVEHAATEPSAEARIVPGALCFGTFRHGIRPVDDA